MPSYCVWYYNPLTRATIEPETHLTKTEMPQSLRRISPYFFSPFSNLFQILKWTLRSSFVQNFQVKSHYREKKTFLVSGSWVCQVSSQSAVLLIVLVVPKRRWFCWLVCIGMRHASVTQFWGFQYNTYLFHSLTQMTPYTWHHRTWSYCLDLSLRHLHCKYWRLRYEIKSIKLPTST